MLKNENVEVKVVDGKILLSVKEVSEMSGVSEGSLRVWISKVNIGDVYVENYCNNKLLNEKLRKRLGDKKFKEIFKGCVIEIIKNVKEFNNYSEIDEIEIGEKVIISNYSFKKERVLEEILESDKYGKIYLFSGSNSKNEDVLDVYRDSDFDKDNIKIEKYEF